jgi:hypothetical protein
MRGHDAAFGAALLATLLAGLAPGACAATGQPADSTHATHHGVPLDRGTTVDHDARAVPPPKVRAPNLVGHLYRESVVEELSRIFDIPDKIIWALGPFGVKSYAGAANVNDMDEVPNSTWFTNRNHIRSVSPEAIRKGPGDGVSPEPPFVIKSLKRGGITPGFQIKDKNGNRWVIKLDAPGYPQAGSGAAVVSSRLIWAAGYPISHDQSVTFRRSDVTIDDDLKQGKDGEKPLSDAELEYILGLGAHSPDGIQYAAASLFLKGQPVGPFEFRGRREDDPNDWYQHKNRRELRGLWVFYSWINNWDVKDHQSLDTFMEGEADSTKGYVQHHLLDASGSLGAAGKGTKDLYVGYEKRIDFGWITKRLLSLGFAVEPWRLINQESGITSIGNFTADRFDPDGWEPMQDMPPFREKDLGDLYWGAKLVASFSDAQIDAAVDAAGYEDPRAPEYLCRALRERRDAIAREWFGRVAPLDFFTVAGDNLMFHDLSVDIGIEQAREYMARVTKNGAKAELSRLQTTGLPLSLLGDAREASIVLEVAGSKALPVRVELRREGDTWSVSRVRHAWDG